MGGGPPGGASQARYIDREVNGSQRETLCPMVVAVAREIVAKGRFGGLANVSHSLRDGGGRADLRSSSATAREKPDDIDWTSIPNRS